MVPVTNEPKPWSVHVQTTRSDMSDLKHAQLRDFLAGNYICLLYTSPSPRD